jgi:hypothetical protein
MFVVLNSNVTNSMEYLWSMVMLMVLISRSLMTTICIYMAFLPLASATPDRNPFPNVPFSAFAKFVEDNFGSRISLATILMILFTLTNNPDLLSLHARQQTYRLSGENTQTVTGWIKALARAVEERLQGDTDMLFHDEESKSSHPNQVTTSIGLKLDQFSKLLGLHPHDDNKKLEKLKPISNTAIEPVYIICPQSMECETVSCRPRSLFQDTRERDIGRVTLIKDGQFHTGVHVLCGKCPECDTRYYADHEASWQDNSHRVQMKFYLNSAKYLKVGQNIWVDRNFSSAVINGTYSFHASSSAFAEFWNDTFWTSEAGCKKLTRRQTWHAYVQESIRQVAHSSDYTLELVDGLPIDDVTRHAFNKLGENGVIRSAENHFCSECTQDYKDTADKITGDDPAGVIGVDENRNVPILTGDDADLAARDAAEARLQAENAMDVDKDDEEDDEMEDDEEEDDEEEEDEEEDDEEENHTSSASAEQAPVKMVVLDGIVMGPPVCEIKK